MDMAGNEALRSTPPKMPVTNSGRIDDEHQPPLSTGNDRRRAVQHGWRIEQ
ncbi:MAG: hypothetical protein PGN16_05170 [Sphingomonas phyllosphaerae]